MSTFTSELQPVYARHVRVTKDNLVVELTDGRTLSVPLEWYPRLKHGTPKEHKNWRLIAQGEGIHWSELDEDISVEGLILGKRSGESSLSIKRWLAERNQARSSNANVPAFNRFTRPQKATGRVKKLAEARTKYTTTTRKARTTKPIKHRAR